LPCFEEEGYLQPDNWLIWYGFFLWLSPLTILWQKSRDRIKPLSAAVQASGEIRPDRDF
jgi:hypothetical protein